jgi:hypothetical protein
MRAANTFRCRCFAELLVLPGSSPRSGTVTLNERNTTVAGEQPATVDGGSIRD